MDPIAVALLAFALALMGILLGRFTQRMVPEGHLDYDSKEVVKLSMGLVATLAALVLGLLVASAKSTYGARESEINQITANFILLDNLLARYGTGGQTARASLRQAIPPMVNRIWREARSTPVRSAPFKATAEAEALYQKVHELQPSNDVQQGLKERITQVATDLAQTRLLLFSHLSSSIPLPFLAVLMLWMVVLFAGFSLMAPANATTFAALLICALSVSGAIFLIRRRRLASLVSSSKGDQHEEIIYHCLRLSRRNVGAGNVARAASSGGRPDHASPSRMRRGNEVEQRTRSLCDYIGPPPCPPRGGQKLLKRI